jgi:hypothetical protein
MGSRLLHVPRLVLLATTIALSMMVVLPGRAVAEPRTEELQFFVRTNVLRLSHGLVPLVVDLQMSDVARAWSAEMARTSTLSHNPHLQSQVIDWRHLGENVGEGSSVDAIESAFEASPGHFQNLMDPSFRNVGIGVADRDGIVWVTVDFKTPDTGAAIPRLPAILAAPKQPTPQQPSPVQAPPPAPAPALNLVPVLPTVVDSSLAPTLTPFTPGDFTGVLGTEESAPDPGRSRRPAALNSDRIHVSAAIALVLLGGTSVLFALQRTKTERGRRRNVPAAVLRPDRRGRRRALLRRAASRHPHR